MPAKKNALGEWADIRFCIDYRMTNLHAVPDRHTMPLAEDLFRDLAGKKIFSSLDLRSGFHQLPVDPDSQPITAFHWPGKGLYAYKRLSFGLKCWPSLVSEGR
jgi:hypothetical protein